MLPACAVTKSEKLFHLKLSLVFNSSLTTEFLVSNRNLQSFYATITVQPIGPVIIAVGELVTINCTLGDEITLVG